MCRLKSRFTPRMCKQCTHKNKTRIIILLKAGLINQEHMRLEITGQVCF